jgi:hypothetical protein
LLSGGVGGRISGHDTAPWTFENIVTPIVAEHNQEEEDTDDSDTNGSDCSSPPECTA